MAKGFGKADAALAGKLDSAKTKEAADAAAQADGHKDAKDARDWLKGRS